MSKVVETRQYHECDVCEREIQQMVWEVFEIKRIKWDVCRHCEGFLHQSLNFLTVTVGLHIPYTKMLNTEAYDVEDND